MARMKAAFAGAAGKMVRNHERLAERALTSRIFQ
jgi:hypothetical protein